MIEENEIKDNWPSAIKGELEHPDLGLIHYWTGEQKKRIVLRFRFEGQTKGESEKIFFISLGKEDWVLNQISSFQSSDSKLKLIKNQSFKVHKELENKYRSIIDLFLESRKNRKLY